MTTVTPGNFREAMDRIRTLRDGGLLLHAARDAFLSEQGFGSWDEFIRQHPQCAGPGRTSPNDRVAPVLARHAQ